MVVVLNRVVADTCLKQTLLTDTPSSLYNTTLACYTVWYVGQVNIFGSPRRDIRSCKCNASTSVNDSKASTLYRRPLCH